jgi:hypothetical protein
VALNEEVRNKPLTGEELRQYALGLLRDRLENDCHFSSTVSYRSVAFEIELRFHFGQPANDVTVRTFTKPDTVLGIEGQPPLSDAEDSEVLATDLSVTVDSPNLARVAAGLPIEIINRTAAKPNELFGKVERHEVKYDPADYPKPTPPVETDKSEQVAEKWGVKKRNRPKKAREQ